MTEAVQLSLSAAVALTLTVAAASVTDLRRRLIPNPIVATAAAVGLLLAATGGPGRLAMAALAGALVAAPMLAVALARPDGLGMGDVKLVAVIGIYLGWSAWIALLSGLGLATITGILISLGRRQRPSKTTLPLAPFLAAGAVAVAWLPLFGPG